MRNKKMSSAMFSLHIKLKMQFICIVIAGHLTWHVNFVSTNLFPITLSEKLKYYIINHKSSSWVLFLFLKTDRILGRGQIVKRLFVNMIISTIYTINPH